MTEPSSRAQAQQDSTVRHPDTPVHQQAVAAIEDTMSDQPEATIELPWVSPTDPISWAAGFNCGSTIIGRANTTGQPLIRFSGRTWDLAHLRYAHGGGEDMARDLLSAIEELASSPDPAADLTRVYEDAFGAGTPDSTIPPMERLVVLANHGSSIAAMT